MSRASGLDIEEEVVPLGLEGTREQVIEVSGQHRVPVLVERELVIWDSLSICERIAERAGPGRVWPVDPEARARARTIVAEMHSGFLALREAMPVDIRSRKETPAINEALSADIVRVLEIWRNCRSRYAGDGAFLFGAWSAADAFYLPVVTRFRTYGVELDGDEADYSHAVLETDLFQALERQAKAEPWTIDPGPFGPKAAG